MLEFKDLMNVNRPLILYISYCTILYLCLSCTFVYFVRCTSKFFEPIDHQLLLAYATQTYPNLRYISSCYQCIYHLGGGGYMDAWMNFKCITCG